MVPVGWHIGMLNLFYGNGEIWLLIIGCDIVLICHTWLKEDEVVKQRMMKRFMLFLMTVVVSLSVAGCAANNAASSKAPQSTITVQDSANRIVEVPYPVQSVVVLWNNPTEMLAALGASDKIVGIDTATQSDMKNYGYYPELAGVPVIGSNEEPNYELIAELDPDVVIMLSTYPPFPNEVQEQLEPFGIAVVALDFYRTDVFYRELTTLGLMLDKEAEAAKLVSFFKGPLDMITSVVSGIPDEERKTVYFEGARNFVTYGGAGYGSGIPGMIRDAGGIDMYPEITAQSFETNPEDVAARNPDVIIKGLTGGYLRTDDADYREAVKQITARPEFLGTAAVSNGEIYALSFDVAGGARKAFGPMYVAKILCPDKLADFDPNAVLREYLEIYLGRTWQGVYVYPEI
jgi:iron complex transport system substrate-binding protein